MADAWDQFADAPQPAAADPWAGFADAPGRGKRAAKPRAGTDPWEAFADAPTGAAHDGDTFALKGGGNARLFGVDAFELRQTGVSPDGAIVPLGSQSRDALVSRLSPEGVAKGAGPMSYGRRVVTLENGGEDVGGDLIGTGLAVPAPAYLNADPSRRGEYIDRQRSAIAAERGAYAGQYQNPTDYRRMGADAPWQGRTPMTPSQARHYGGMMSRGDTRPADLEQWAASQGHPMTNADNLLQLSRRTPTASLTPVFQQRDVTGAPVLRDGPGLATRLAGSFNEGLLADVVGSPVDLLNTGMRAVGLPMGDRPIGGSQWISDQMHKVGIGQVSDAYAPRSTIERYGQAIARGAGQAALPVGGALSAGAWLAASTAPMALRSGNPLVGAVANLGREAWAAPGAAIAGELSGGVGAGVGGQVMRDAFPGNPYADALGQVAGGFAGGMGAGSAAARRAPMSERLIAGAETGADSAGGEAVSAARNGLPDAPAAAMDDATYQARAQAMFDAGASADDLRRFASEAGGYALSGVDEAVAYRNAGGKGARVAGPATDALPASPASPSQPLEAETPSISLRRPDRIDISEAALPPGFEWETPGGGFSQGAGETASPAQMAAMARGAQPADFQRLPSNVVGSLDEAVQANPGTLRDVVAPDPRDALPPYKVGTTNRRQPMDLVTWMRSKGGLRDDTGDLKAMGIGNAARDFDRGEGFLGRLVHDGGMSLDDAAEAATSAGFFNERPDINQLLAAIDDTYRGTNRLYRPDDLNTIDAYEQATAERDFVNQARDEGAPLTTDVGQPVTLDDLDANSAPATAYEDLGRVAGGLVGNIRLDKLESGQDISRALAAVDYRASGFDAARRGVVTQAETAQLARELGMTSDDLLKRQRGQALNAEQALAARAILAKSGDELTTLAERATGGSDAAKAAFQEGLLRHMAIQEQVAGATSEAGRTLAQFRMIAKARDVDGRVLKRLIETAGGSDRLEEVAKGILELRDPGARAAFMRKAQNPTWRDKLIELRYNFMLSGPQTHAVNIISNSLTSVAQLPEHAIAAGIGGVRRAVGTGDGDRVLATEVGARAVGLANGFKEGLRQFGRTLRTGDTSDDVTKVESVRQEAISGLKGRALRIPTRLLSAEDELFKAMARRMELAGLATRQAYGAEGLKGGEAKARVADLVANPPDKMLAQAFDYARYATFQRPLGGAGQAVSNFTTQYPLAKLVVPFVRTPTNLLKFALERSPGAPLLKEWRDDIAAGGARRDLAAARALVGSAAGLMAVQWATNGHLTGGGPADKAAERLMRADGWQPYSVRIGDRYYSYRRLDPFSTTIGIAADMVDLQRHMTEKQQENVVSLLTASVVQNLSGKTWLSGLDDLNSAIKDPGRFGPNFIANTLSSFAVPAVVGQTARTIDPFARDAQTILDRIRARVPGASKSLAMRRDLFGNPIVNEGGVGPDMVSPIWTGTAKNDPTIKALLDAGMHVGLPKRSIGKTALTAPQYSAYLETAGRIAKPALDTLVKSPGWLSADSEHRQKRVTSVLAGARTTARSVLASQGVLGPVQPKVKSALDALAPQGNALSGISGSRTIQRNVLAGP